MTGLSGYIIQIDSACYFRPPAYNFVLSPSYCVLSFSLQGLLLYGKSSSGGCILMSLMQTHEVLAEKMKAHSNSVIAQNCKSYMYVHVNIKVHHAWEK